MPAKTKISRLSRIFTDWLLAGRFVKSGESNLESPRFANRLQLQTLKFKLENLPSASASAFRVRRLTFDAKDFELEVNLKRLNATTAMETVGNRQEPSSSIGGQNASTRSALDSKA